MATCRGCGGVLGRDCFNQEECEQITAQMAHQAVMEPLEHRVAQLERRIAKLESMLTSLTAEEEK